MESQSLIEISPQSLAGDDSGQPLETSPDTAQQNFSVFAPVDKTHIKMVIHGAHSTAVRCAKLDTGAQANILSGQVVDELSLKPRAYDGPNVLSLGESIKPLGAVDLVWSVIDRHKTYTTEFLVIDKANSNGFDALIGEDTLKSIGFFMKNVDVWFSSLGE
ncbi:MAG: hypothetical protein LQ342_005758 [Letrouitia transgressa]|nr:MAG: hypothetical protein LQ342_005758 [Letrouitia transgressa]